MKRIKSIEQRAESKGHRAWSHEHPYCDQKDQRDNMNNINNINHISIGHRAKSKELRERSQGQWLDVYASDNNKPACPAGRQRTSNDKQHKPHPCLPQGGFDSGVCPGAAAITILYTYTGGPRGTLGGSHTPAVINGQSLNRNTGSKRHKAKEDLPMI